MEPPCQKQVPGVAIWEARALYMAVSCHSDGFFFSVQVCEVIALISPEVGVAQSFDGCALRSCICVPIAAEVCAGQGVDEDEPVHLGLPTSGQRLSKTKTGFRLGRTPRLPALSPPALTQRWPGPLS